MDITWKELREGQEVTFSKRNIHKPSGNPSAYGGMSGVISSLDKDGFVIESSDSTLIVGLNSPVYLTINGVEFKVKGDKEPSFWRKIADLMYRIAFPQQKHPFSK